VATRHRHIVNILQEFSIPLLSGVVVAMLAANLVPEWYHAALHWQPLGDFQLGGRAVDLHFLVNEVFMVFFFGIAAKEITESCLPGGSLNPIRKALNPLIATAGGVIGPALVFLTGLWLCFGPLGVYGPGDDWTLLHRGWGIPTATDIALAWLVARAVFGKGHSAIDFLLLLAIADDAVGLIIIAVFYGDPRHPTEPMFLLLCLLAVAVVFLLRRARVKSWIPYVGLGGPLAWSGMFLAHLHPALALCFVVPFLPAPHRDTGFFVDEDEVDKLDPQEVARLHLHHSALHNFEHQLKLFVDLGLFFFAFTNAGVELSEMGPLTWLVLLGLAIGKTCGVTLFGLAARAAGFPLPTGMSVRDLAMAGFVAALGLTVALFVATAAFYDPVLQGQAKMGALFSGFVGLLAIGLSRVIGFRRAAEETRGAAPAADAGS
jgi:NhaA family Na+:H+ antiporter